MSTKHVYVIKVSHRFEDGSSEDFEYTFRVYSSLRKALDCLELYNEMYITQFNMAGYDIECDVNHWVDYREDGYYSHLTIKNGCSIKTYQIIREILY